VFSVARIVGGLAVDAYRAKKAGDQRQQAYQHAWDCLQQYSGLYRSDPIGERGIAQLPFGSDSIQQDIHRIYLARVHRARKEDQTAIMFFQQFISEWSSKLPPQTQYQLSSDLQTCHQTMQPDALSARYQKWADAILDTMLQGQSNFWIPQFVQPQEQPLQTENQPVWAKQQEPVLPPGYESATELRLVEKQVPVDNGLPLGYENAVELSIMPKSNISVPDKPVSREMPTIVASVHGPMADADLQVRPEEVRNISLPPSFNLEEQIGQLMEMARTGKAASSQAH